ARSVGAVDEQKLLIEDRVRERGIEVLKIVPARDQLAPGRQNPRTRDAACVDRVAQLRVAINAGMAKNANRGDAALQVFASILSTLECAFGGRFHDSQQVRGRKERVEMALTLFFGRNDDTQKQMRVTVNQARKQSRAAKINDRCAIGSAD